MPKYLHSNSQYSIFYHTANSHVRKHIMGRSFQCCDPHISKCSGKKIRRCRTWLRGNVDMYCNILTLPTPIPLRCDILTFWHRSFTFNSNKSPTWCKNFSVYYPNICLQLNMFRAFSRPSSGAQWLQWQPLVLPSYRGDSRAVFVVGPAGRTTNTARLSPRYEGKTRGCHCSHWAPDDGRENALNLLSCKQTSG